MNRIVGIQDIPKPYSFVMFTGKNLDGIIDLTPYKKYLILQNQGVVSWIRDDAGTIIHVLTGYNSATGIQYRCYHLDARYVWQPVALKPLSPLPYDLPFLAYIEWN